MGIIIWIVIGLIAGWLANQILGGRSGGLLYNLAVGLVGAIVGGLIFGSLNILPVGFRRRAGQRHRRRGRVPVDLARNQAGLTRLAAHPLQP